MKKLKTAENWSSSTDPWNTKGYSFAPKKQDVPQPNQLYETTRNYIVPAAKRAGITKPVNFHVFRHTF